MLQALMLILVIALISWGAMVMMDQIKYWLQGRKDQPAETEPLQYDAVVEGIANGLGALGETSGPAICTVTEASSCDSGIHVDVGLITHAIGHLFHH